MLLHELKLNSAEAQAIHRAAVFLNAPTNDLEVVEPAASSQVLDTAKQTDRALFKTTTGKWVVTKYLLGGVTYAQIEDPRGKLTLYKAPDGTDDQ